MIQATQQILWSSVYLPTPNHKTVRAALDEIYTGAGYASYNPYPGGTGTPKGMQELIRLFVARGEGGWTRIIGLPDMTLLPILADRLGMSLLHVWISTSDGQVDIIGEDDLSGFLREGKTQGDLQQALNAPYTPRQESAIGEFASQRGLNPTKADKLIQKTTRNFFKKLDNTDDGDGEDIQAAASAMVSNNEGFSWGSVPAQRVAAMVTCLTLPDNWQNPDYKDLAAAYQIACLLDLDEDAPLLPGDEALLDKVEYPLDYKLAYYAR